MNKRVLFLAPLFYFLFLSFFLSLVFACAAEKPEQAKVTHYKFEKTILLHPENPLGPQAEFSGELEEPEAGELQNLVRTRFYAGKSPENFISDAYENYAQYYRREASEIETAFPPELRPANTAYEGSLNYYQIWQSEVAAVSERLLSFSEFQEAYFGGAHGTHLQRSTVIDLNSQEKLTLKDVFLPESKARLESLIDALLRTRYELPQDQKLSTTGIFLVDRVEPSENFTLLPEGIEFCWNEYEVAPYSTGLVSVFVNWQDIKDLLTPRAKDLLSPWIDF